MLTCLIIFPAALLCDEKQALPQMGKMKTAPCAKDSVICDWFCEFMQISFLQNQFTSIVHREEVMQTEKCTHELRCAMRSCHPRTGEICILLSSTTAAVLPAAWEGAGRTFYLFTKLIYLCEYPYPWRVQDARLSFAITRTLCIYSTLRIAHFHIYGSRRGRIFLFRYYLFNVLINIRTRYTGHQSFACHAIAAWISVSSIPFSYSWTNIIIFNGKRFTFWLAIPFSSLPFFLSALLLLLLFIRNNFSLLYFFQWIFIKLEHAVLHTHVFFVHRKQ